ncbi:MULTISPECIES: nuclear transport factor 2 family protein [Paenibacillus]|uniref:Nuclear transport factor 2 family protein n=1 Tax=Paenibacillus campinasensis TaxID=66347 RepID=A0A268EED7_9BACL|nr:MULTISPECIES: nuclear transport factor 2 family protein [Paenibacillus]MUG68500.1 hypothetical protein [Paenibacillus campinasensis]PAD71474.1 hypothetical protein CHH67_24355 [Paenibacillus campinasensis]PAK47988.1 hypothetical protein CHH75_23635 [Paenibacillus sp. 7541]
MNGTHHSGMNVICAEDCGNAPKKLLLRDYIVAWAQNNIEFIEKCISEEVCWDIIGDRRVLGKAGLRDTLQQKQTGHVTEIEISTIITHGSMGAINGTFRMDQGRISNFCHVFTFSSAGKNGKIKKIMTYMIEDEDGHIDR